MKHHARKRFGQHFLTDHSVLDEIVNAMHLQSTDQVVEIGPGQGALTQCLLSQLTHLDVVELDRDLVVYLKNHYDPKQLTVHAFDALDFDYAQLAQENKKLRIVGNLPYNISTPLLFKLFSQITVIQDMHFMLQKEVVLRLTAEVGSADYGRLSVMSQYFCENEYLLTVPPTAFNPPPKVDSAVVRLTPKIQDDLSPAEFKCFSDIVKEAFNYRRKKLGNALKAYIAAEQWASLEVDPDLRPQDISISEFIRISKAVSLQ